MIMAFMLTLSADTSVSGKGEAIMNNWQKVAIVGLVAGSLALGSFPALAGTDSPRIDQRQANQQQRIYNGVDSGRLTPQEFNRVEARQANIRAAEARMKADGRFTKGERLRVNSMLTKSSRQVYRAKHNNRVR
jgi:hypothetical protein